MRTQTTGSMTTKTTLETAQKTAAWTEQWGKHLIYIGLGGLGGAIGVAVAIGLTILFVLSQPPSLIIYNPGPLALALMATPVGLGTAWLLKGIARQMRPPLFQQSDKQALQIILIAALVTGLIESLLLG